MLSNLLLVALRKKGISQRKFAKHLWENHEKLFESLDRTTRSLEARLTLLGRGERLEWWEKNPDALQVVARELGVEPSMLCAGRGPDKYIFTFASYPALPALDLKREDRYHIGRPEFISDEDRWRNTWPNLDHWFFGEGSSRSPEILDWLQIEDETEFRLIASHLAAASRHTVLVLASAADLLGEHVDVMRHRSPLIVAIDGKVGAGQLQSLRDRAQTAPLLVISRHALPSHQGGALPVVADQVAKSINMWRWTLDPDWRGKVIAWVEQRLAEYGVKPGTSAKQLIAWLATFDPGHRWLSRTGDVLQLCRIAQGESFATFVELERGQNTRALLERVFDIKARHLRVMESVIRKRWNDWRGIWDGELAQAGWKAAGATDNEFQTLMSAGQLLPGDNSYRFANPLLSRLVLRHVLGTQIRTSSPDAWWPACFDGGRRALVDATLDTMSIDGLAQASRLQKNRIDENVGLMGAAEALFVAIGKRLARGADIVDGMQAIGDIVLSRLAEAPEATQPWSRPYDMTEQRFEWISSVWIWSLFVEAPKGAVASWRVPGWNRELLPEKFPDWLNPRASYFRETMPVPRRESLAYFSDAAYLWSKTLQAVPQREAPPLLVPALMWRGACGAWPVDPNWWGKILVDDWSESMLLRLLTTQRADDGRKMARLLWPSLVAWQMGAGRGTAPPHVLGKELQLSSCRPDAQRFSSSIHWIAQRLAEDDVLGLLTTDGKRYLDDHPQWLLTEHKLVVLRSLAKRLPLALPSYMAINYFSAFLPDAVAGLVDFLHDEQLGGEAAVGVWNWAPLLAVELLQRSDSSNFQARSRLILTCPTEQLGAVLAALQSTPDGLPAARREAWARYHLPNAGVHAAALFELLKTCSDRDLI